MTEEFQDTDLDVVRSTFESNILQVGIVRVLCRDTITELFVVLRSDQIRSATHEARCLDYQHDVSLEDAHRFFVF
jgi:hypothetical protein